MADEIWANSSRWSNRTQPYREAKPEKFTGSVLQDSSIDIARHTDVQSAGLTAQDVGLAAFHGGGGLSSLCDTTILGILPPGGRQDDTRRHRGLWPKRASFKALHT